MYGEADERAPLLQFPNGDYSFGDERREQQQQQQQQQPPQSLPDAYRQFCQLVGNPPEGLASHEAEAYHPPVDSLYSRATRHRLNQGRMYVFTSALTNTLILSQVVLGAALTGLGASDSNRVLIVIFGALNTIIAGLVAFLKSRGQPMRARMFRDDLDRVVDEIENSATMWKGISQNVHGYDAIDTDDSVTVRSEVARLTRLYDRAVKTSTMNDPDIYGSGISMDPHSAGGLRSRTGQQFLTAMPSNLPAAPGPAAPGAPAAPIPGPSTDPDESPATTAPTKAKKGDDKSTSVDNGTADKSAPDATKATGNDKVSADDSKKPKDSKQPSNGSAPPASEAHVATDPDESPATSVDPPKAKEVETAPKKEDEAAGASKNS